MQTLIKIFLFGIITTTLVAQNNLQIARGDERAKQIAFQQSYEAEAEGEFSKAITALTALSEDIYEVNLRLGWLYYLDKNYTQSVVFYSKSAEQMPNAVEPLMGLINPLVAEEKWIPLEAVYLKIVAIDPNNSKINYRLGLIYYYRKDYIQAEAYFTKAQNLYPFDYDICLMGAWNKYYLGKFHEAKTLFNRVLLINPEDSLALEGLALIRR